MKKLLIISFLIICAISCKEKDERNELIPSPNPIQPGVTKVVKPTLVSPENNTYYINVKTINIEFKWAAQLGARYYNIVISNDSNFKSIIRDFDFSSNKCNIEITPTTDKIYWKVRAFDSLKMSSDFSSVFRIEFSYVTEINITNPKEQEITINNMFTELPIISWDEVYNIIEYEIYGSNNPNFIDISGAENHKIEADGVRKYKSVSPSVELNPTHLKWNSKYQIIIRAKLKDGTYTKWAKLYINVNDPRHQYLGKYFLKFTDKASSIVMEDYGDVENYQTNSILLRLNGKTDFFSNQVCSYPYMQCTSNRMGYFVSYCYPCPVYSLTFESKNDTMFVKGDSPAFTKITGYRVM